MSNWEKEFDEQFGVTWFPGDKEVTRLSGSLQDAKDFIFNLLAKERQKAYEKGYKDAKSLIPRLKN